MKDCGVIKSVLFQCFGIRVAMVTLSSSFIVGNRKRGDENVFSTSRKGEGQRHRFREGL